MKKFKIFFGLLLFHILSVQVSHSYPAAHVSSSVSAESALDASNDNLIESLNSDYNAGNKPADADSNISENKEKLQRVETGQHKASIIDSIESKPKAHPKSFNEVNKRNDVSFNEFAPRGLLFSLKNNKINRNNNYLPDVNEEDKEQEEEINKKSKSLGLEISQNVSLHKVDTLVEALTTSLITTTTTTTAGIVTSKNELWSKRNFEIEPTRIHYRKADTEKSSQDTKDNDDDEEDEDDEDEEETKSKKSSKAKKEKSKKKHKKSKKKAKKLRVLLVKDKDVDDEDDTETAAASSSKLSSKQLQQIYKFMKNKKDQTQVKDPLNTDLLLSSLVLSSNDAVNRRLKDSLAAKAANKLLNKWHSYSPLASLQELEEMYQKFYDYYYESNYGHADHHHHHHHHHLHHHDSHEFFEPHHHHHIHDLSHRHHHLNLLDFLESKSHKENDEEENKDQNLVDRLLGSNLFSALNLNGLHAHHFSHHHHYDSIHPDWDHDHDHDYYKPIRSYHYHDYIHHPHRHHHHHHHHHHRLSYLSHQSDHDHIDYIENYRYLKRNYLILKNKINYYQSQNMPVPWSLFHDYNRLSHMLDVYHEYPHRHHHHHHLHHLHHHHFGPYAPRIYGPDHYLYPYDELAHYDDDFNVHHLIPHIVPHYNDDVVKFFDKQMFLPQLPGIQHSNPPVVCTNYPDHTTEGFKSFISVESCTQPSYMSSSGIPVFGEGCTFHYICELGYQPIGAGSSSSSMIRCNNGFWTARAVCIKQEISNNNKNVIASQMKPLNAQTNSPSFQNKLDNLSQQHLVQSLSIEQSPRIIKRNFRLKRSKKKPVDDYDYNSFDKSSNEPIELLSESIEKQLQNEIFWTDDAQQQQKDFLDRSEMNSSQSNATQTQTSNVPFTTTALAVNETTISSTKTATEAEILTTESYLLDNTTTSSEVKSATTKIISSTTTTYIVPTTTTVPTQVINVTEIMQENLTDPQKKILDPSKMNHHSETSSPSNIFRKKLKAQTKTEDNLTKNTEIPIVDWTSIMNNDSEKTIYETFYELLDNGYDYQNRHNFEKNANKKKQNSKSMIQL